MGYPFSTTDLADRRAQPTWQTAVLIPTQKWLLLHVVNGFVTLPGPIYGFKLFKY